jgi:signal transduction histidine kinase
MSKEQFHDLDHYLNQIDLGSKNYKELYERGLELIKNEPQPKKLLLDILDEYIERLEEIPPVDINSPDFDKLDEVTKEKIKSLVLFGTQAVLVRENAKMQDDLRRINANYRDLLSVVTHEFKNAITSIHGYNRIVLKRLAEGKIENLTEVTHHIDRMANSLFGLVDTLFSMSLIEQGKLKVERRVFDLVDDAINPVIDEMEIRLQKKKMSVKLQTNELKNYYLGDERFFQLVFRNLIQNALQYGKENTAIKIDVQRTAKLLSIIVFNQGSGIEEKKIDKVFEKFSRFHDQNEKINVGIGLYTVKNIIEIHGGTITAETRHSEWMRFTIDLPIEN